MGRIWTNGQQRLRGAQVARGAGLFKKLGVIGGGGGGGGGVQLVSTTGVNKNANLTISGGGLIATGGSGGGANTFWGARANTAKSGKRQFELTLNAYTTGIYMGLDAGAVDFSAVTSPPGLSGNGIMLHLAFFASQPSYDIRLDGVQQDAGGSQAFAVGDTFSVVYDTTAGTVGFYKTRSGVTTQVSITYSGISASYTNAFIGVDATDSLTANFGATAFARTLDSGFSAYNV
jgi:hypothetical protein